MPNGIAQPISPVGLLLFLEVPIISCTHGVVVLRFKIESTRNESKSKMTLPEAKQRVLETPHGKAIGASYRWEGGQYCAIHTARGLVGCGVFSVECADEFNMAFAVAKRTPQHGWFILIAVTKNYFSKICEPFANF